MIGLGDFMLGNYSEAIKWLDRELVSIPAANRNDDLGRVEWNRLFRIAAYANAGQIDKAKQALKEYDSIWRHRSVWRMLAYLTRAQARTAGYKALQDGLIQAGMPQFMEVQSAESAPATLDLAEGSDFAPTPATFPQGSILDANGVRDAMAHRPSPHVLDVGRGAAVIPGALWSADNSLPDTWLADQEIEKAKGDPALLKQPVIVMGTGVYGLASYAAALSLVKAGFTDVSWFRGGEEAWTAAKFPADDQRVP
jgi:rhodanese-related sulfurtransferase